MKTANQPTSTTGSESCNSIDARQHRQSQALHNALAGQSLMNYEEIFRGFIAMGIPSDQIKPRENVFTFNAWLALGRAVKKGQHGVKVCTFVQAQTEDDETGERKAFKMPRQTTVFHVSQTEPVAEKCAGL